ncbi:hypothetical protein E4U53_005079 [Claviceps sorghi]|nr:hypothetical protein E4U53_005079 [Claviceps sorghi]
MVISAPHSGKVASLQVREGDSVDGSDLSSRALRRMVRLLEKRPSDGSKISDGSYKCESKQHDTRLRWSYFFACWSKLGTDLLCEYWL